MIHRYDCNRRRRRSERPLPVVACAHVECGHGGASGCAAGAVSPGAIKVTRLDPPTPTPKPDPIDDEPIESPLCNAKPWLCH